MGTRRFHSHSQSTPRQPYARFFLDFARSAASRHRRTISVTMMYVPTINRMTKFLKSRRSVPIVNQCAANKDGTPIDHSIMAKDLVLIDLFALGHKSHQGFVDSRCRHDGPLTFARAVGHRYPTFAFSPVASMPATAQASSLSDVSPLTPTAPSNVGPFMISTPPGTGTRRPCASAFTAPTK